MVVTVGIRRFGKLYMKLRGVRIARVALTPSNWNAKGPEAPVILVEGQLCSNLLFILSNQTEKPRTFTISGGDCSGIWCTQLKTDSRSGHVGEQSSRLLLQLLSG